MSARNLNVEIRNEFGKNASNRLRLGGYIPAVLYSHGISESLKVPVKEFSALFKGHISESVLIDLSIKDKKEDSEHKVFVKDYLLDPVTEQVLHLDFYKITAGEKIRTMVPVITEGTPVGVKAGGILEILERELEIECLPADLPEKITINVANLEIGNSIHISDIKIGDQVKFIESAEKVITTVITPHVKEEEEEVAEEEVEGAEAEAGEEEKADEEEEKK